MTLPTLFPPGRRGQRLAAVTAALMTVAAGALLTAGPSAGSSGGETVSLSGVYTEVHGDASLDEQTRYFLRSSGHYYQLETSVEPDAPSAAKVTVHGSLSGNTITVASGGVDEMAGPTSVTASSVAATGTKSVLVINVVWPGSPLRATRAEEQTFMFGRDSRSVASFYSDVSYGQLTWAGTTTPRYTIHDIAGCDLAALANRADKAATAGGYHLSSYTTLMINAPNLYCGANGYGEIGGQHTWIQNGLWNLGDGYARYLPTHEIGRTLGLYHSHGLECSRATLSSSCLGDPTSNNDEYGNAWDAMGNNWPGDGADSVAWLSAKQEIALGWLTGQRVRTVTTSGTYFLAPLEKSGVARPQVLVIKTPSHTYYVEYRQPIGQDAFLSQYPSATNSVQISVSAAFGVDTGPFALDFTPNSKISAGAYDWYDAPLAMGRSFSNPGRTFTVSPVSHNGTAATVKISFA